MSLLHWEARYSVGIAAVDHEHQDLIALINRLYDAAVAQGDRQAMIGFFGELFRAISSHFALEERLMRERNYDHLAQHKADHERLLDEIRDIMDDVEGEDRFDAAELARRLDAWFSRHFETHDARLHHAFGPH
ncbi:bacteriohemerythrin [Bradyrhizobium sp. HKCCYLS20291]|uniref:bacteriohemerythrin n=1 Tax=Bradyrhizobium sp. HKCCYLS20291 TaxID=3420766 RepID=UPI003EBBAB39